ncbi:unnamed protein product [Heterobilharzia americana]|nr:unnamed protein product [Heterobilharzia americana]
MQCECLAIGVIKSIQKLYLEVQLPNGSLGRVNIYDVSDKYTELLRVTAETGVIQDDLVELSDMFTVGQIVRCYIKETVSSRGAGGIKSCIISLNPKMVNKAVICRNIKPYMVFIGSVMSIEDHGYLLDSGVPGISCFLPTDQAAGNLIIGSLVTFTPHVSDPLNFMSTGVDRVMRVTTRLDPKLSVIKADSHIHFDCLLPGTCITASVVKKVTSTLIAKFSDYLISISRTHYIGNKEDYPTGTSVTVCIILVDPSSKQLTGSLLPHLVNPISSILNVSEMFTKCPVGKRFSSAVVMQITKRAVLVKLPKTDGLKALIRKPKSEEKNDETFKSLVVGSKMTCRITDHDFLENVAIATANKKLLKLPFLSLQELEPGTKVSAFIKRYAKTGIVVQLEGRLHGLIPYLHTTDVNLKDHKEKFKAGEKVSCLVLHVDKFAKKLLLTAKPGLLNAECIIFGSQKMFIALDDKDNTERVFVGFIVKVSEKGLLVSGLDNIRGWIPKRETGLGVGDSLQANFYRGQVLKVKMKRNLDVPSSHYTADENQHIRSKYLLSLKFDSKKTTKVNNSALLESIKIGQIFKATVGQVSDTALTVDLYNVVNCQSSVKPILGSGCLSYDQLSDFISNQIILTRYVKTMQHGSTLTWNRSEDSVVVIGKDKQNLILSARPTLIQAARDLHAHGNEDAVNKIASVGKPSFLRSFEELQIGSHWFTWVSEHRDYGVLVSFPSGIRGLAPKHLISDYPLPSYVDWKQLFPLGATVIANIVEVDHVKRRCLISLKMFDIYNTEVHYEGLAIRSLNYWLTEREWMSNRDELLRSFRIGDEVIFKIELLEDSLISGMASKQPNKNDYKHGLWIKSIAYKANILNTECVISQTYPAIVCFVDHLKSQLEVVLSPWLVNGVINRKENVSSQLKGKQQVSSIVLARCNSDMVVVGLRGHALGLLGVVPAKRTFNDITGADAWSIGQRNKVTFRESFKQDNSPIKLNLCTLSIYDAINGNQTEQSKKKGNTKNQGNGKNLSVGLSSSKILKLEPEQCLTDLYFVSISSQTAFFAVGSDKGPHVLCHLVNWDTSVKAIKAFLNNPPEVGTKIDRTATVLFSMIEDKLILKSKYKGFRSKIAEISFLEKRKVSVGDLVCAQLSRSKSDYWTVFLPGGSSGRLHVTDMNHSDVEVEPLDLTKIPDPSTLSSAKIFNIHDDSNQIKPHYFIACRIVDQKENISKDVGDNSCENLDVSRDNEVIYFVSNKLQLIRDNGEAAVQQSIDKLPEFNVPADGFVKVVTASGLIICLSRTTDILIPFPHELATRLKDCGFHFKVGDHLLVCPKSIVNGKLVGELVCNNSDGCEHIKDDFVNILMEDFLYKLFSQKNAVQSTKRNDLVNERNQLSVNDNLADCESDLAVVTTEEEDIPRKRKRKCSFTEDQGKESRKIVICEESIQSLKNIKLTSSDKTVVQENIKNTPKRKYLHLEVSNLENTHSLKNMKTEEKVSSQNNLLLPQSSKEDNIFSEGLLKRYQKFMYPGDLNEAENEIQTPDEPGEQLNVRVSHNKDNQTAKEWHLRENELRKAMLATLTTEQQRLPKGELHPKTTEEFELAVRNMPSNEACWVAYMTHILSSKIGQESIRSFPNKRVIDARAIAERGLRAISNSTGINQLVKQSRLLTSYLIMEAKELERLTCLQKEQRYHLSSSFAPSMSDLVIEINHQSKRVSQLLTQLLNLDQAPFIRRAIDTLSDIGHHTRAEELARRQIKSCPGDVDRWLSLVRVRFRAANVEAAREAQRNAASLLKSSLLPQLAIGVARIEFEYGDVDRGIHLLQEQLSVHSKRKTLYEECIKLLLMNDKLKEARLIQQQAEKNLKPSQYTSINAIFEGKDKH